MRDACYAMPAPRFAMCAPHSRCTHHDQRCEFRASFSALCFPRNVLRIRYAYPALCDARIAISDVSFALRISRCALRHCAFCVPRTAIHALSSALHVLAPTLFQQRDDLFGGQARNRMLLERGGVVLILGEQGGHVDLLGVDVIDKREAFTQGIPYARFQALLLR